VGTGLLIVNPPWRLADELSVVLPALAEVLEQGSRAELRIELLAPAG
jgi:23S rRNA (adenine2030-N6)-methyltransferase